MGTAPANGNLIHASGDLLPFLFIFLASFFKVHWNDGHQVAFRHSSIKPT